MIDPCLSLISTNFTGVCSFTLLNLSNFCLGSWGMGKSLGMIQHSMRLSRLIKISTTSCHAMRTLSSLAPLRLLNANQRDAWPIMSSSTPVTPTAYIAGFVWIWCNPFNTVSLCHIHCKNDDWYPSVGEEDFFLVPTSA